MNEKNLNNETRCEYCGKQFNAEEIQKDDDGSYSCLECRQDVWDRNETEPERDGE